VRYGYRRLHILLLREGWSVNHKRTYRIYREEGLSIRPKLPRRKRAWRYRQGRPDVGAANEVWAMDFMSDQLFDGRPFRLLTVVDCHTREALSIAPRVSFRAFQVIEVLDELVQVRGQPRSLRVDNGPEFALAPARPVGLPEGRGVGLLQAGEADRQCLYRGVQRSAQGRVPEHLMVPVHD
jgi:putative transposase